MVQQALLVDAGGSAGLAPELLGDALALQAGDASLEVATGTHVDVCQIPRLGDGGVGLGVGSSGAGVGIVDGLLGSRVGADDRAVLQGGDPLVNALAPAHLRRADDRDQGPDGDDAEDRCREDGQRMPVTVVRPRRSRRDMRRGGRGRGRCARCGSAGHHGCVVVRRAMEVGVVLDVHGVRDGLAVVVDLRDGENRPPTEHFQEFGAAEIAGSTNEMIELHEHFP